MKKVLFCTVSAIFFCLIVVTPLYAETVSSQVLINNAKQYDGKIVTYQGEAVGDIMARGDHAWINLNDGYIAVGVWVKKAELKDIVYLGSYREKGDIVEVTGVFHRACPEHGGDLDIHAQEVKKIIPGRLSSNELNVKNIYIGFFLSLAVIAVFSITKFFR